MKKQFLPAIIFLITTLSANCKTYTVASVADTGPGTLRAAIDSTNANPGMDTIVLNLSTTDNIYLQSPLDNITDSLLITGNVCSNPTINGGQIVLTGPALNATNASAPLIVNYVNFAYCNNVSLFPSGGAISANLLYLNYCYFHANSVVDYSGADDASGGAVAANSLTASNCTFDSCSAGNNQSEGGPDGNGGAVYTNSVANFYNCTFNNNQADYGGGGLYGNNITVANIINCTFVNNGSVALSYVGGGALSFNLANSYTVNIANNIFWGNTGIETPGEIWLTNGNINSGGCNILQAPGNDNGFNVAASDIQGTDPVMGVLANHGGCVPTIPIGCGSVAINHATCTGFTTSDARGIPDLGGRDAGAFQLPAYIPVLGPNITQCGGSVTLTATPQVGINTYIWSTGATTDAITVSTSGYYHVFVADTFGCRSSDSLHVYIEPKPYVNLGTDTTQCGGTVTLNAGTPGDLYQWSNTQTTETITVGSTNTYAVTVTDPNSACSASSSVLVTIKTAPVVNLGPDIKQCGGSVTLNAGNAGDNYNWSTTETTQSIVAATSGNYIVTVTSGINCSSSASVNVYIEPAPFVSLGNDTTLCGGTVSLNAGNPGYTYLWSNGATTQTITAVSANTYSVTVTNPNSLCSASSSINVNILGIPLVNLGPDINQCGGTAILNAGNQGLQYNWSNDSVTQTETVSTSGTYTVTVTSEDNCTASVSIQVYIKNVPVVNLGPSVTQCGGSVTLDAGNNNYGYAWSTGSDSSIITVAATATYYVTVTDPNTLCTASDSVSVTIDTLPVVNLGPDTTQCGGSVTLFAQNTGSTYLWSSGTTNDTLNVTSSNVYRVTVTNSNGCSGTGSIAVTINPVPVVSLSLPANICITTAPFALTGGLPTGGTYFEADSAISIFNPNQQGLGPHQITYVFANNFGCVDSDSASVTVRPQPSITTSPLPYLCTTSSEINLNQYFAPAGGFYTGVGVNSNLFYPSLVPAGADTIIDIYTDNFGCKDTATYSLNIHPPVHVSLTPSVADFTICLNQSITFTASGANQYQFYVNGVAQGAPSDDSTFTTTTLANHSEVYVIGSNPCSTDTSEPMVIDVITPPVVYAGNDTTITLGQTVQLHGVATGTSSLVYQWMPGNGLNFVNVPNPTYSGSDSITFTFKATDSHGCADSAQVSVYVTVPDNIQLPNVITPNGDGYNDVWKLNSKIDLDGSNLVIFDRWGQIVYQTENYANNWGGTYKSTGNLLPDGTYYYVLKVPAENNHVYEGPVSIISGNTK